jgi:maltokinase
VALSAAIADLLPRQRWFAGGDRRFTLGEVRWLPLLVAPDRQLWSALSTTRHDDGETVTYQVLVGLRPAGEGPAGEVIGTVDLAGTTWVATDPTSDADLTADLLAVVSGQSPAAGLAVQSSVAPERTPGRPLGVEQSNTSLVYGEDLILKLYRRLAPDPQPDVEVAEALTGVGSRVVAPALARAGTDRYTLALLQPFFRTATEGWALALASARSCLAAGVLDPAEDGADFAADACRLGAVTAELHADLRRALPTRPATADDTAVTLAQLEERLAMGVAATPELAPFRDAIRSLYARVPEAASGTTLQRVHGDFHLGQVLRTDTGWVVLDFEGEPARPVDERRALMSPLRDVAGMLRSFDYASRHLLADSPDAESLAPVAEAWSERNRAAFCEGYGSVTGTDPRAEPELLTAFELDKAVYEVGYEARYRPSWLPIPLGGIARLTGAPHGR